MIMRAATIRDLLALRDQLVCQAPLDLPVLRVLREPPDLKVRGGLSVPLARLERLDLPVLGVLTELQGHRARRGLLVLLVRPGPRGRPEMELPLLSLCHLRKTLTGGLM